MQATIMVTTMVTAMVIIMARQVILTHTRTHMGITMIILQTTIIRTAMTTSMGLPKVILTLILRIIHTGTRIQANMDIIFHSRLHMPTPIHTLILILILMTMTMTMTIIIHVTLLMRNLNRMCTHKPRRSHQPMRRYTRR